MVKAGIDRNRNKSLEGFLFTVVSAVALAAAAAHAGRLLVVLAAVIPPTSRLVCNRLCRLRRSNNVGVVVFTEEVSNS
jgi:hypothetical protein